MYTSTQFLVLIAIKTALITSASAQTTLIESDFTGTAPGIHTPWTATSVLDPNLSFTGWDLGSGITGVDAGINDALGCTVSSAPGTETTLADAIATNAYLTCTIDPAKPIDLNGSKVLFQVTRHEWHSARTYAICTSVDGFTEADVLFETQRLESGDTTAQTFSAFLPSSGYNNIQDPLEIRIYAYAATYGGHNTSLSGFSVVTGIETVSFSMNSGVGGTSWSVPDRTVFEIGETVQLYATPDTGFRFAGWLGDVTGYGNPRALVLTQNTTVQSQFGALPAPSMSIGVNLDGVEDWSTSWIFSDLFKRTRAWMTRATDSTGPWDSGFGFLATTDADGWPTQVPFDPGTGDPPQFLHTILSIPNGNGDYTLSWSGSFSGRFVVGSSPWTSITPSMDEIAFTATSTDIITLEIHDTQPSDSVKDISIVRSDNLPSPPTFEPLFQEKLSPFTTLRFMDWGRTNGSWVQQWSDRTSPLAYSQSQSVGVAPEIMIDLANSSGQDAWFCVPHQADDTYVRELARLIRDTLDPTLKAYIEYSNETWNTMFTQTTYVQDQGEALGLSTDRWIAGHYFVALRSVQIFTLFDEEFGAESTRLVHVLASHVASTTTTNHRIAGLNNPTINPNAVWPDALAVAPYFGPMYTTANIPPNVPDYPTVDEILDTLIPAEIDAVTANVQQQKIIADAQGLDFICYEAGQHILGIFGAENDTTLTQILTSVNRDPRMYDHYITFLDMLRDEGVSLCAAFSFCTSWGKWGSWGSLEYLDQPLAEAPKYRALVEWGASDCPNDLNGDGVVGISDVLQMISEWGDCQSGCAGDLDNDGEVAINDLLILISAWGSC